jgi:hypothetical protein
MRLVYLNGLIGIIVIALLTGFNFPSNSYLVGLAVVGIVAILVLALMEYLRLRIYVLTPIDLAEIQKLSGEGKAQEAIILTLRRAYNMKEEDILKLSKADVVDLLARLNKALTPTIELKPNIFRRAKNWVMKKLE